MKKTLNLNTDLDILANVKDGKTDVGVKTDKGKEYFVDKKGIKNAKKTEDQSVMSHNGKVAKVEPLSSYIPYEHSAEFHNQANKFDPKLAYMGKPPGQAIAEKG